MRLEGSGGSTSGELVRGIYELELATDDWGTFVAQPIVEDCSGS